jgi:hypothetical protein
MQRGSAAVRRAGSPSWQIVVDHPQALAMALYVRDVAGVRGTAESNAWWSRALTEGPRAVVQLRPRTYPAFDDAPAVLRDPAALHAELRPVIRRLA